MIGLRIAALLLGITIGLGVMAMSGMVLSGHVAADGPAPVPPHRHFTYSVSGEKVYVGPNFCTTAATAEGFYAFHWNVHVVDPGLNDIRSEPC